ncbi:bifunctional diguanylate cyclase/phosphodiesterase [Castellaniella sp.]|uniref:bifunctional diguanylate cyclase/phosphodiesterase n=1 Tax=Castellaniella sp. TaxID=1955812 RepID=UPI003C7165E5
MAAFSARRTFSLWFPGFLVAVLGFGLTYGLVQQQRETGRSLAQIRFSEEVRSSSDAMTQRIVAYAEVVAGLRDLFMVNPDLDNQLFERVVAQHDVRRNYPELVNLSFVRRVRTSELPAYEARLRARFPAADPMAPIIHPRVDRPDHYIVEYLWPREGNESIWGLDIASQPANLAAVLTGRATGRPVTSAPFALLQEKEDSTAFVLRFPVFHRGEGDRFIGAVAAVVRVSGMLDAIRASGFLRGLSLRVQDVGAAGVPGVPALLGTSAPPPDTVEPGLALEETRLLDVMGRTWRLDFAPSRALLSPTERMMPWWIGGAGAALTLLLVVLASLLTRQRTRAFTEVASTHEALRRSEERFRAVFNQAAVGVSLTDVKTGALVRVNQKYCDILGYTRDELLRLDFQKLTHPDDLERDLEQMRRVQAGEIREFRLEKRVLRKGGESIWVDLTVSPIWKPGEAPDLHVAVIQDVDERRRMQDALQDRERHLRSILDHLPVGVCLVRHDERITFRNRQFVQIFGYAEQEVPDVQAWWARICPDPDVRERARQHWARHCAAARLAGDSVIAAGEYRILCGDGAYRTVEIAGVLLGDDYLLTLEDLTSRKAAEEEINYLAFNDSLTGLPNRRLLLDRLQQTLASTARHQRWGALLMLDLDHFKTLNETRGHDCGDLMLRQVAERLRNSLPDSQTVARHGDDEFVVVLEDLGDSAEEAAAQAEETGQRILTLLSAPYLLEGEYYHATVSMGAAIFHGQEQGVDEHLKRADLAMYQAKAAGRNTMRFYDPLMQAAVHRRATLELDMRIGLEQGQFELFYQPQKDRDRIIGCEALLRWHHPQGGFISPAAFIPLAEETGLILPLGEWVLRAACTQLACWAQDPEFAHLSIAVNVSPRQFHEPGFVDHVLAALAGAGADASRLELELTEGLLLQDIEDTIRKMVQLKGYGVGFSLDDFGTGYSSLAYLKRLPLDQLKIDQSFVRDVLTDPNDAAIARTIVGLGISLGLRVIAEGVETEAQRAFLERHHCHAWQGYLLSRPLPVAEFEALVRAE